MKNENLTQIQKAIKDITENPIPYDGIMITLLTSIATYLAQIADVMIDKTESEVKE